MSRTITVSTRTQLYDTLATVTGGETILLQPGDYGRLALGSATPFDITFPSNVTIASANPGNPAVFTSMSMNGAANLTVRNVTFDYTFKAGEIDDFRPFEVRGSSNITISGSSFNGDVASGSSVTANGFGTGIGLSVRGGNNIKIQDNEFFNWKRGLTVDNTSNVVVSGNEVHDIRSDGLNFSDVQNVRIENNYIHDFRASYASGDHRDMIQFWTNGTTEASTNIVIRNNKLDIGNGSYTQSIFMRNEEVDTGRAGTEMFYRNILIEHNEIYNGHLNGISVGATSGLTIRKNSVIAVTDKNNPDDSNSSVWVPAIDANPRSTDVLIETNAVAAISGHSGQAGWVVRNNAIIQNSDPFKPGHYDKVFFASTLNDQNGVHDYAAQAGSLIEQLNAGAAATRLSAATTSKDAFFNVSLDAQNGAERIFDASYMTKLLGTIAPGADYQWSFGDGTTASGRVVSHVFTTAGTYDVKLVVRLADGTLRTADADVGIQGSRLVSYDGKKAAFQAHEDGEIRSLAPITRLDGEAIQLGGAGTAVTLSRSALKDLRGSTDFAIDFTLKADSPGGSGEIFRQHEVFTASMSSTGQLNFQITTEDGRVTTVSTVGLRLNDGRAHDLSIRFKDGEMEIWANGAMNVERAMSGALTTNGPADLVFGNPWGRPNFAGDLSRFDIRIDVNDYPAQPRSTVLVDDGVGGTPLAVLASEAVPPVIPETVTESGMHEAGWDGKVFDIASFAGSTAILKDNAHVATGPDGAVLRLDGDKDHAVLGRQTAYEAYDHLGFSVDFKRDVADGGAERLIWNHMKVGLTLTDDGLMVQVATLDQGFKSFAARNLGLNDTDLHRAEVMIDTVTDRLQVVLDGEVVIDAQDADFELTGAGGREAGWTIGTAWDRFFDGEVHDFRLGDRFDFLENYVPAPNALLS